MKRILLSLSILTVALSCTRGGRDISIELSGGQRVHLAVAETLRVGLSNEPPSLDWQKGSDTLSSQIIGNIMEGLMEFDLADRELGLKPALALKVEPSNGARNWKITLRSDVVWSDGVPFTAQHVVDGWHRLLDRATAANSAYFLYAIKNARDFNRGTKEWSEVGVHIDGPHEIRVELDQPMGYFPYLLTHHSTYPVRIDVVSQYGSHWTDPAHLVTLGPYHLLSWQHDKMIVLERNESYYGTKPAIKNIAGYIIQEQSTQISLFSAGQLDFVDSLPSVELKRLRGKPEYHEAPRLSTYYYGFNTTLAPLNQPLVRRALAMAIDRKQIVQMLGGGELPLSSWVPSGMFGYEAERGLSFQPEKARELLKRAGYADPSRVPLIELKFNSRDDHQRIAENIQAQLKTNLGLKVELKSEEWKVYLASLKKEPPQIFRSGWQADYPDPNTFLALMLSYSENNYTRWKNPEFDELVLKAASSTDREERRRIYSHAQKILLEDDVPVMPLFSSVSHVLVSTRVVNYPLNAMGIYAYKGASLK